MNLAIVFTYNPGSCVCLHITLSKEYKRVMWICLALNHFMSNYNNLLLLCLVYTIQSILTLLTDGKCSLPTITAAVLLCCRCCYGNIWSVYNNYKIPISHVEHTPLDHITERSVGVSILTLSSSNFNKDF